ncbi:MAG: hypothetical protein ACTHKL_10890, partial [Streptosporangiaceae bacterium]
MSAATAVAASNVSNVASSQADRKVTKIEARLADGREIVYFDESDDADRALRDTRDLPASMPVPTIRYDARLDEWVGMSDHRQDRTYLPADEQCPLCPS